MTKQRPYICPKPEDLHFLMKKLKLLPVCKIGSLKLLRPLTKVDEQKLY
jgi:hypothetical protein